MTTATRSVAVVATRLPTLDRRALSQAWYSALHVATPAGGIAQHSANAAPARAPIASPISGPAADPARSAAVNAGGRPPATRPGPLGGAVPERRGPAGELARRIERGVVRQTARGAVRSAAFAIDAGNGRVHLLVRTDGGRTRIVALCAPHLRERVDRALAHARFALAAAGTRIEAAQ